MWCDVIKVNVWFVFSHVCLAWTEYFKIKRYLPCRVFPLNLAETRNWHLFQHSHKLFLCASSTFYPLTTICKNKNLKMWSLRSWIKSCLWKPYLWWRITVFTVSQQIIIGNGSCTDQCFHPVRMEAGKCSSQLLNWWEMKHKHSKGPMDRRVEVLVESFNGFSFNESGVDRWLEPCPSALRDPIIWSICNVLLLVFC